MDASRAWYLKVEEELNSKRGRKSKYDNALFFWRKAGSLQGIMCCHVDDFFYGGTPLFDKTIIQHLKQRFKLSAEHIRTLTFTGINFKQTANCISMSQESYIDGLVPIRTDDLPKSGSFNSTQIRRVRGLVGQLQWAAKLTRPDISFSSCNLSSRAKHSTMIEAKEANKLLKKLKLQQYEISIPNIGNIVEASLVVFSDASHKILADGNSQGGFIVFLKGVNEKLAPLVWTSHRLKRVVKSAMAAETMALLEAAEHAMLLKSVL